MLKIPKPRLQFKPKIHKFKTHVGPTIHVPKLKFKAPKISFKLK